MPKTVTITLPEGYEDATHIVVLAPGESAHDYEAYATVLPLAGGEPEEMGGGTLTQTLGLAARSLKSAFQS